MSRTRGFAIAGLICLITASVQTRATTLEQDFISRANWCPGTGCTGATIQAQHQSWHGSFAGTREFVDYHREFLAQSDDFRLYGADVAGPDPDPAIFAIPATPGTILQYQHTSLAPSNFNRPALHVIDAAPLAHTDPGGVQRAWPARPATLTMGNATFCGYTVAGFGSAIDGMYHGNGHMSVATHDSPPGAGDMATTTNATRDGAFYQWHKHVDEIYSDWAVSKYQLCNKSGIPIYISVSSAAVGAAASNLADRRGSNVYQGNIAVNPATQYGAIPRIASDIYVADNDNKNLLYASGVRQWGTLNAWDIDALSILNQPGSGWYFSVSMASVGAPATAVNAQAVRGGDIFESGGGGANALYRTEGAIGLVAAATDELDAIELDLQRRVQGSNDNNDPGIFNRPKQYFSLRNGSTFGIQTTSGTAIDDSDILAFGPQGQLTIAVAGTTLGFVLADDLDAIAIVDTDASLTLTAADRIYYSLVAGSPSGNPGDVYCKTVAGANCGSLGGNLEITAASLGLLVTDELDALDIRGPAASTGACCQSNGTCSDVSASSCSGLGGTFAGLGTVCSALQCPSAPGACCSPTGCSQLTDQACLASGGVFKGAGVTCVAANCPITNNDECTGAYEIPYDHPPYYEPPADNTYAYENPTDPPYSCADHNVFFPPYGSGTIWYYYDVPGGPGTKRSIALYTDPTGNYYPYEGGGGDTRLGIYYSSSGNCSTLQEVTCGDNEPGPYSSKTYYARARYDNPAPGRYYVQVSTVGAANRGVIRLAVTDPNQDTSIPALGTWGIIVLAAILLLTSLVMMSRRRRGISIALIVVGLLLAMGALSACASPPRAAPAATVERWPDASRLPRDPTSPTLVMFAHPRCECTRAGLVALSKVMTRAEGKIDAYVLFAQPEGTPVESLRTASWTLAASIPGVTILGDEGRREAALFGAAASGQVMLYDGAGTLAFSGSITPVRGVPGDSPLMASLLGAIDATVSGGPIAARVEMPSAARGCALDGSGKASAQ